MPWTSQNSGKSARLPICQNKSGPTGKPNKTGFVIGRAGFGKISAVEGIRLKPTMEKRAAKPAARVCPRKKPERRSFALIVKPELRRMYDAIDDPYTYENSTVLVNKRDLRNQDEL